MTDSSDHFVYDFNSDKSQLHVYDDNSKELKASPVSRNGAWEIPRDLTFAISRELQWEIKKNGFTDRFVKIVNMLAQPGLMKREEVL